MVFLLISSSRNTWVGIDSSSITNNKRGFPYAIRTHIIIHLSLSDRQQILATLLATRQVGDVRVRRQCRGNLPARLDLSDLNETVTCLGNGLADGLRTLGLTLGADDVRLALLLGLLDDEAGSLGVLLGNLLLLDGLGEFAAKGHVGDGHVLQSDVELGSAAGEILADALGDGFSLGDELGGIELGDDGLENLVADGGQDSLIIVDTEVLGTISTLLIRLS